MAVPGGGAYVDGVVAAPTPPVQVQMFESASYTCEPTFSIIPYGFGPAVSVMTPTFGAGPNGPAWNAYGQYGYAQAASAASLAAAQEAVDVVDPGATVDPMAVVGTDDVVVTDGLGPVGPGFTPAPEFTANACGCCRTPFSVLPPATFEAWRPLIERVNAPYSAVLGCRGGGPCGGGGLGYGMF
jgi:hypothetical protein